MPRKLPMATNYSSLFPPESPYFRLLSFSTYPNPLLPTTSSRSISLSPLRYHLLFLPSSVCTTIVCFNFFYFSFHVKHKSISFNILELKTEFLMWRYMFNKNRINWLTYYLLTISNKLHYETWQLFTSINQITLHPYMFSNLTLILKQ